MSLSQYAKKQDKQLLMNQIYIYSNKPQELLFRGIFGIFFRKKGEMRPCTGDSRKAQFYNMQNIKVDIYLFNIQNSGFY